jgi:hypothetical protein
MAGFSRESHTTERKGKEQRKEQNKRVHVTIVKHLRAQLKRFFSKSNPGRTEKRTDFE